MKEELLRIIEKMSKDDLKILYIAALELIRER